jgi:fermentation-respiration switch protein FrsA (DUF1100 family)
MPKPVTVARTIVTDDGVPIDAAHLPGDTALGIVMAHGFTQNWQRPWVWRAATRLNRAGGVVTFDFRGHGRSGGLSTLGDKEISDVDVAVAYARELGYSKIATIGFSMGASIVLRHAGLVGGVDAVVSVSGPGRWFYRGRRLMRRVHWAAEHKTGRLFARAVLHTRISDDHWDPIPVPPADAAARISPVPLLVVHGEKDEFFPVEHAKQIYDAAREPKELWIEPDFGHAESGARPALLDRIAAWVRAAVSGADVGGTAEPDSAVAARPDVA